MNDADDLESIREQKREQLQEQVETEGEEATDESFDEPVSVTDEAQFAELTDDHDVVLVDFYADWCGPCKMLEPTVESVAANTDAVVAKVDVDVHQGLANQHGVRGVPSLVLYADGEQVEQLVGVQDESTLTRLIERYA
ncbi:thioredoxin [Halorussus halophilus]|uniref:thioredoxin n=1 Tax=Halorussus halophilus TaxID=2650975 RepID=UPI0013015D05|nr:thioredoxin [Halorussus halophilus]